jgi:hypothetical protein
MRPKHRWWRALCVAGALSLLAAACAEDDGAGTDPGQTQSPAENNGAGEANNGGGGGEANNGGGGEANNGGGEVEECVSDQDYFLREVWTPILSQGCFECHNPLGVASQTEMVYQPAGQVGFLETNLEVFTNVAAYERDGVSVMLLKPTAQVDHFGGRLFEVDSESYQAISSMLERLEEPTVCPPAPEDDGLFDGVELLTPAQTLRKASLHLAGRLPTDAELEMVQMGGEQGMEAMLDKLTREEGFYTRMEEVFNDVLLVEKYLGRTRALDLLDRGHYPGARWYDADNYDRSGLDAELVRLGASYTNDAVAREPLELVSWLLREDRPFTELLTADYIMVNPYSAVVYGAQGLEWEDPLDPDEFQPATIQGFPHAGVLTSPMFLNRFPTTDTNRNRHRSRMVYLHFLATDILKLAERPIDPTSAAHNPTMNDPQCAGCHSVIDPLAGAFQNWDDRGSYAPPDSWYTDMRSPGFNGTVIDAQDKPESLRWLAREIVSDRRFGHAMAHIVFKGLTGQAPLPLPQVEDEADHAVQLAAYESQQRFFDRLAREFEANGADLRVIVKGIARSPWFRASGLAPGADEARLGQLGALGTGRLLPPEMLSRKLQAILNYPWRPRVDRTDYLLDVDNYRILYGGIDSDDVIERISEPNGVMAAIQQRMANEMSCAFVPRDFVLPASQRALFPYTELTFVPEDDNGFAIPAAQESIRRNIQHLHWRLLGERLEEGDPELEATWQLFFETWKEGKALRDEGAISRDLNWSCQARTDYWTGADYGETEIRRDDNYLVRSWQAVITYLLMDYRFLYE